MSPRPRISQMSAILIEHARAQEISELQLQRAVQEKDNSFLNKHSDEDYNYDGIFEYAMQYEEDLESAIVEGYQIKFNTLKGLQTWLSQKFNFKAGSDFQVENDEIRITKMTDEELQTLASTIATNWRSIPLEKREGETEQTVILQLNTFLA